MKIAFLSDVHANHPALLAALEVAEGAGAERVVVAGDVVGDGPHPVEVVAELRRRGIPAIRGNVDRKVLAMGEGRKALEKKLARKGQKANRAWTALQLLDAEDERAWLASLPTERTLDLPAGRTGLVVHGSPRGDTDYVFPSLTPTGLAGKLEGRAGARPALLVCGHSHVPFAREVDGVTVVNCGSVGRPADGDPTGTLGLVEVGEDGALRAEIVRFPFPLEPVVRDLEARGVPAIDPETYLRGVKP